MFPDVSLSTGQTTLKAMMDAVHTHLRTYPWYYAFNAPVACTAIWILLRWIRAYRRQLGTTQFHGPPGESFLYGVGKRVYDVQDSGSIYEAWAEEYGPIYMVPSTLGTKTLVLCDPKAIAHFYAKDSWTYCLTPATRKSLANSFGKGMLWAHGENHWRQRKSLTPAFSIPAIRQLTSIFYDGAYKTKGAWDILIESSNGGSAIIDVQSWMNHISLDSIGLAGFSHNFGALEGKPALVTEMFDTLAAFPRATASFKSLLLLTQFFPSLSKVPTVRAKLIHRLNTALEDISNVLLSRAKEEIETKADGGEEERSIIGLLIKGANADAGFRLTKDEVLSQMKVLFIAGYESTSITLTWTLLELSRNPDVQTRLRKELIEHDKDPTYDELSNGLPYLDAVVHEILRLYPPGTEQSRIAVMDDVIPLSEPVRTKCGRLVDSLTIAKGTLITIPIECMNRSTTIWGKDAKLFRPSRWLEDGQVQGGIPAKAKEIQGHRHLLTFGNGPRTCLGMNFALTEIKTVVAVLIKNFVLELRDGVDSKIETGKGMLPRPRIAGEVGCKVPLRVRSYIA